MSTPAALASPLIAQQASPQNVLLWVGVLIAVVLVAGFIVLAVRRHYLGDHAAPSHTGLMDDLRAMRDRGEITPDEFDRLKKNMADRLAGRRPDPPPENRPIVGPNGALIARPGFDLTGDPLPQPRPIAAPESPGSTEHDAEKQPPERGTEHPGGRAG